MFLTGQSLAVNRQPFTQSSLRPLSRRHPIIGLLLTFRGVSLTNTHHTMLAPLLTLGTLIPHPFELAQAGGWPSMAYGMVVVGTRRRP